ncbi:MAG TPA: asparagine synthase-related protein [Alphaproteobacteria bacterium]|nr:asparagine synthase-related protein [Alphaproteobacteria bacterium]
MSAIFGILRFDGGEVSARDLERMGNALAHRGPDGRKSAVLGAVGLGHGLMRVNEEDLFEAQPLADREADLTLVADCRIDNREELAEAFGLSAGDIRDMPDSAFILRAYKKWGADAAAHLIGDFAFAIWDGRAKKLVLARDHMGQRYFHHHAGKDFFAFATEARALWALDDVPRRLSDAQIARYLLFQRATRDGATFFEDIRLVPGGSTVVVDAGGRVTASRYWEPRDAPLDLGRDEAHYVRAYREILTEAVECRIRRLIAPPALLLSAGYDSAAIAGLSGPLLSAQGRKLTAISSVLPEDYRGPRRSARHWVELCRRRMPHLDVRYFVRDEKSAYEDLEQTFAIAGHIPPVLYSITAALLREATRSGARLLMDGVGGDDTVNPRVGSMMPYFLRTGHYRWFLAELAWRTRACKENPLQVLRGAVVGAFAPLWLRRAAARVRSTVAPFQAWRKPPVAPAFAAEAVRSGAIDPSNLRTAIEPYRSPRERLLRSVGNWAGRYRPPNDADLAAASGLDITRPFRDKRVVELGLSIPEDLYAKGGRQRYLACKALADIYPPEFQNRDLYQDTFDPDLLATLRASLPQVNADIARLKRNPNVARYIDFERVARILNRRQRGPEMAPLTLSAWMAVATAKYIAWFRGENA